MPDSPNHAPAATTPVPQETNLDQQMPLNDHGAKNYDETYPSRDVKKAAEAPQVEIDTTSRMGRGPILLAGIVAVILIAIILFGILQRAANARALASETRKAAIATVAVTHATGGAAAQQIRLPADTQAYTDTAIYSRTNGYLQKWYADIGTNVRKGQLLAVVQTPEVDQQVQQMQADVSTAKANEQLAETTNERWKALLAKNAVSRQEADQTAADLLVKKSALNAAEADYRRLLELQSFEHIYAPFDGVITERNVDVGSLIQAGDSNTPHAELFHLNSVGTLRLFVPVPEIYVGAVRDGEKLRVTSDAYPGENFFGTVVRNATAIDMTSRTLKVEIDVANLDHRLLPGQYAFVYLDVPSAPTSLTLPSNTLLFRAEGPRVGVVRDHRVHLVPITIGHDNGATIEVTTGLTTSDMVILNPSDSLADGSQVNVEAH